MVSCVVRDMLPARKGVYGHNSLMQETHSPFLTLVNKFLGSHQITQKSMEVGSWCAHTVCSITHHFFCKADLSVTVFFVGTLTFLSTSHAWRHLHYIIDNRATTSMTVSIMVFFVSAYDSILILIKITVGIIMFNVLTLKKKSGKGVGSLMTPYVYSLRHVLPWIDTSLISQGVVIIVNSIIAEKSYCATGSRKSRLTLLLLIDPPLSSDKQ